jgi:hypothetical protein
LGDLVNFLKFAGIAQLTNLGGVIDMRADSSCFLSSPISALYDTVSAIACKQWNLPNTCGH